MSVSMAAHLVWGDRVSNFFCAPSLIVTSYSKWTLIDMILASKWIQLEAYVGLILSSPSYGTVHKYRWCCTWSDGEIVNCLYDIWRWVGRFSINRQKRLQYCNTTAKHQSCSLWDPPNQPPLLLVSPECDLIWFSRNCWIPSKLTHRLCLGHRGMVFQPWWRINSKNLAKML